MPLTRSLPELVLASLTAGEAATACAAEAGEPPENEWWPGGEPYDENETD